MLRTRVDMGKPGWAETKGRAQNTPAALKTPDQRRGFPGNQSLGRRATGCDYHTGQEGQTPENA